MLRRDVGHQEVWERLEYIALLVRVPHEEAVSVDRVVDHVVGRKPTELDDFKHLIIVVFSRKNRQFYKKFDRSASE